ncbi:C40 family peptidase [Caldalkalibacillus thermarum]|uniref:C40 family peptidase n=1 Tax=Caldalkalibacillus thermarum TaxID=296745 RepID=UPI0016691FAC|nr:C40 family peptidase [Caldalkalibacillus thermarum]
MYMKPKHEEVKTKKMVVCVSVATVWTEPDSPRFIDQLALNNPVDIRGWLTSMTLDERLKLCTDNLVQTQALYGTVVHVLEEQEQWAKVVIPIQPSRKDERGYPGWMPLRQLSSVPVDYEEQPWMAEVTSATTVLFATLQDLKRNNHKNGMEVSFLTRLPVINQGHAGKSLTETMAAGYVEVLTPHGPRFLKADHVRVFHGQTSLIPSSGDAIVETAKKFLDLPYLWGGMSAFGYDCSGFAYSVYRYHGITLPRDASDQVQVGTPVGRNELEAGDLLFFAYEQGRGSVHHVGIYAGDDHMIHSPKTGKSIEIIPLKKSVYEQEFCGGRRYISSPHVSPIL